MFEFFKGWRRKVGCLLLIAATGFTGLWLRSLVIFYDKLMVSDFFPHIPVEVGSIAGIVTRPNFLVILKYDPPISEEVVGPNGQPAMAMIIDVSSLCEIPFWSIVIPIVLLSGYLILWPRHKQRAAVNSTAEKN